MKYSTRLLCGALLVLALPLRAEEVTLKIHHFLPPTSTIHAKLLVPWCENLARESAGRLKCRIFPAMQLGGSPPQLFDQAKDGVADITWTLLGYSAGRFPLIEVFELPFMIGSAEAASTAVWEYSQTPAAAEYKDVKPLAFHTHEAGHFFLSKRPVTQLGDLRGLKLRAPTRIANRTLAALGATPLGMPVPQVAESLARGVIDGALLPYEVVPALKIQEVTKFASETDASYPALYTSVFMIAMNKAKYESLPPDLQKILDANSGAALSAWGGRIYDEARDRGRRAVAAQGNAINTIPAAELERWRQAVARIDDEWVAEVGRKGHDGKRLLEAAKGLIAKHAKK
jgi:TRAP-type C4-dicarboxylate transport system substrate-binding protein